jgi:DNA-binding NtrC family response regulator
MPGQNGIALADAARQVDPSLPVVLICGYNASTSEAEARSLRFFGSLSQHRSLRRFSKSSCAAAPQKRVGEPTQLIDIHCRRLKWLKENVIF